MLKQVAECTYCGHILELKMNEQLKGWCKVNLTFSFMGVNYRKNNMGKERKDLSNRQQGRLICPTCAKEHEDFWNVKRNQTHKRSNTGKNKKG